MAIRIVGRVGDGNRICGTEIAKGKRRQLQPEPKVQLSGTLLPQKLGFGFEVQSKSRVKYASMSGSRVLGTIATSVILEVLRLAPCASRVVVAGFTLCVSSFCRQLIFWEGNRLLHEVALHAFFA